MSTRDQVGPFTLVDVFRGLRSRKWEVWVYWPSGLGIRVGEHRVRRIARSMGIAAAKTGMTEFQIRNRRGQISEKNTYTGHDPRDVQG